MLKLTTQSLRQHKPVPESGPQSGELAALTNQRPVSGGYDQSEAEERERQLRVQRKDNSRPQTAASATHLLVILS